MKTRLLAVSAAALALTAAAVTVTASATAFSAVTVRSAHAAPAHVGSAHAAPARHSAAPACNPYASSIRPSGPAVVTPGSFMAKIKARGFLIAGVDQSTYHFGFLNPLDNQIEGFDIDMIHAVAKAIFGNPDQVEFKAISDAERIPDLENGSVDIVAHTMTITCARLQEVDFSSVYYQAYQRVLVQTSSTATSLADLKGQKVCATQGSDSVTAIAAAGAIPDQVTYWTDCLVLLQQDQVAAISTDDSILDGLAAQDPFTKVVGPLISPQPYGLGIARQHPDFVAFVNAVLQQLRTDGQWKASYVHWIGSPAPAPPAAQYGS